MRLVYIVKKEDLNMTYRQILRKKLFLSSTMLSRLKFNNRIKFIPPVFSINEYPLENSVIDIQLEDSPSNIVPAKGNIDILFEDQFFLFVNKPSGIPSHPSKGHYFDTLANYVEAYLNLQGLTSHIINRLDKDTSGIVVFAKNSYFHSIISQEFEKRCVEKTYIAVVHGKLTKKSGFIEKPIKRSGDGIKREINERGKYAVTMFEVIEQNENFSVLKLKPITGRTHQIRVHLASIDHPIVGDSLYGIEKYTHAPLLLHDYSICFKFKLTEKEYKITAPLPYYFSEFLGSHLDI
ncbi:RluA family pseudouridine synthase [Caldicellulosiruptor morganii]|uniref:Pseudouridine synthase n=1 Tax=Caldicellulosiruptor morganii TaxID=1387555 RepID=A0ABY7BPZ7_9FIRM|nr:RluA family pseudouridine synthase [Caldicellulosiruptor morganii]WAM34885.1 RluA family pseudouridine synthase [Caldicellulosiruptor morganii]